MEIKGTIKKQGQLQFLFDCVKECANCNLVNSCKAPVTPTGSADCRIMFVVDHPTTVDDKAGQLFSGVSRSDFNHFLKNTGISRFDCYFTSLVKCCPPVNKEPSQDEIKECVKYLQHEIEVLEPELIVLMGKAAIKEMLGSWCKLETYHGIPYEIEGRIFMPCYHPSAGLFTNSLITHILYDFEAIKLLIDGEIEPRTLPEKDYSEIDYRFVTDRNFVDLKYYLDGGAYVGVDTETTKDGIYCLSVSMYPGTAYVVEASEKMCLKVVSQKLKRQGSVAVIHNALFDLPVLAEVGIRPRHVVDTMVISHHLQQYPQGLKPLCSRLFGIPMTSYSEIIEPYTEKYMLEFTGKACEHDWEKPEPVVYLDANGDWKEKKPQSLSTKLKRMLNDYYNGKCSLYERWSKYSPKEIKVVEEATGMKFREADLSDAVKTDPETVLNYSAKDADCALRVYNTFTAEISNYGIQKALELDYSLFPIISDMQSHGMKVDVKQLKKLGTEVEAKLKDIEEEIHSITGEYINPASSKQVSNLLFDKMKLQAFMTTPAGEPSTSAMCLRPLRENHPVVGLILEYREALKLKTTYIEKLVAKAAKNKNSRIYPNIKLTRTATGRLATSNPNLQAIPVRSKEGKKIRECFVADKGNVLLSCDYSQIEMRMVAHLSNDKEMLEVFYNNTDLHKLTASKIFGIPMNSVDESMRYAAKRVGFGVLYGLGPEGLHNQMVMEGLTDWTKESCVKMIDDWFAVFHGVADYFESKKLEARRNGYVKEDIYGRIRLIPEIRSNNKGIVSSGERKACSMAIQGAAQQVMKTAMKEITSVYKKLNKEGGYCYPLIQIHDDIVWEVGEDVVEDFKGKLKEVMTGCVELRLPLEVEIKAGYNWADLIKEDDFFKEDYEYDDDEDGVEEKEEDENDNTE